jgi:hypothetical protein
LAMACAEHYRLRQEYERALRKCAPHMHSSTALFREQALASRMPPLIACTCTIAGAWNANREPKVLVKGRS